MMIDIIKKETEELMDKAVLALQKDFSRVRTGRASLSILDGIRVDYYGVPTALNQIASLSIPEPRLILVQPWDVKMCVGIEKALFKSNLGIAPVSDGKVIRIPIPPLTEERREDLVKIVRKMGEDSKIAVRNTRRDANDKLKVGKKEGNLSEDDLFRGQSLIQKSTDDYIVKIGELLEAKEKEILNF